MEENKNKRQELKEYAQLLKLPFVDQDLDNYIGHLNDEEVNKLLDRAKKIHEFGEKVDEFLAEYKPEELEKIEKNYEEELEKFEEKYLKERKDEQKKRDEEADVREKKLVEEFDKKKNKIITDLKEVEEEALKQNQGV
jgi:hypothetical protein